MPKDIPQPVDDRVRVELAMATLTMYSQFSYLYDQNNIHRFTDDCLSPQEGTALHHAIAVSQNNFDIPNYKESGYVSRDTLDMSLSLLENVNKDASHRLMLGRKPECRNFSDSWKVNLWEMVRLPKESIKFLIDAAPTDEETGHLPGYQIGKIRSNIQSVLASSKHLIATAENEVVRLGKFSLPSIEEVENLLTPRMSDSFGNLENTLVKIADNRLASSYWPMKLKVGFIATHQLEGSQPADDLLHSREKLIRNITKKMSGILQVRYGIAVNN